MKKYAHNLITLSWLYSFAATEKIDTNISKLKASNACMSCNLNRTYLSGAILNYADLRGGNPRCCRFLVVQILVAEVFPVQIFLKLNYVEQ